jgi:coenzyme F420-reducing hydrogenase beta subunit
MRLADKNNCCGCGACANACRFDAIHMNKNKFGYLYPEYNANKCVDCGLCTKSCPVLNYENKSEDIAYYAGHIKQINKLQKTASGGAATTISEMFIQLFSGVVVGCKYDNNNYNCYHEVCSSIDDLNKISGTKYIQSEKKDIFSIINKLLKQNKKVLFIGTPCEVAALSTFLKAHNEKNIGNLYSCDFICHGPISSKIQFEYIERHEKKKKSKCNFINPKNKIDASWTDRSLLLNFENGESIKIPFYDSVLGDAFVNLFRNSCGHCVFKKGNNYSDITLGDFWGCSSDDEIYQSNGVSLLISHTEKGNEIVKLLKKNNEFKIKEIKPSYALKNNPLYGKSAHSSIREKFIKNYKKGGLFYASNKCLNFKDRIRRKLNERTV